MPVTVTGGRELPTEVAWWHARWCLAAGARSWPPRWPPGEAPVQSVGEDRCSNHEQKKQVEEAGSPAVLLANHGVLVFHRTPELAILVGGVVEEAAQAGINAAALGGPVQIPPDLRAAALQRAMTFDARGTVRA